MFRCKYKTCKFLMTHGNSSCLLSNIIFIIVSISFLIFFSVLLLKCKGHDGGISRRIFYWRYYASLSILRTHHKRTLFVGIWLRQYMRDDLNPFSTPFIAFVNIYLSNKKIFFTFVCKRGKICCLFAYKVISFHKTHLLSSSLWWQMWN